MDDIEMTGDEFDAMQEVSRYAEPGVGWVRLKRDPVACTTAVELGRMMSLSISERARLESAARAVCIYHIRRAAAAAARIVNPVAPLPR